MSTTTHKVTTVTFRTDRTIKDEAKKLYSSLGMDLSTAINVFLRQSIRDNGIPFKISAAKVENSEARHEAETHEGKTFTSTDALMKDLLDA